jgi:hypothetical protein
MPRRVARRTLLALALLASAALFTLHAATNAHVTVSIDAAANRHAINPLVYGVSYGSAAQLWDLRTSVVRLGGNNTSRYNWQQNADNRGADWYFESVPAESGSSTPGEAGDSFIANAKAGGAQPMLTFPMLRWVAKVGSSRSKLASFSIRKYGSQTDADWTWYPDAGNGVRTTGAYVTGNDPNDANVANSTSLQQQWAQHLVQRWGNASGGGLRYYILDNEYSIWQETHRDVQPTGARMDEIRDLMVNYAAAIKSVDSGAQIVGPEEWGWSGFKISGYDQQYGKAHGWGYMPDQSAHGGTWYVPYLLDQIRQASASRGVRLLDVLTVHWYPQSGEFGNDTSQSMQLMRNRSTRALWDSGYLDPTWINDYVQLVPRLHGWVNAYYPGTKIGITEYSWGADGHINGATAQADILGIFGREGLDIGARWVIPDASTPTYKAMKMWRNYDNNGGAFGDTSVKASVPNPDELSAFAAVRGDGALTVMVINKVLSGSTPVSLSLGNFAATGSAAVWQLTSANAINRLGDLGVGGSSVSLTVPAQSITLLVIPGSAGSATTLPMWHSWFAVDPLETPMVGDFNGDGKTDIVTFTRDNPAAVGDVYVALSNGSQFVDKNGVPGLSDKWNDWFAISHDEQVVIGDFDGDRKDDIATWLGTTTRQVYVSLSYGSGMSPSVVWLNGIGSSSSDVLLAGDVNGDGKKDLVLFARREGKVYVALSTGSGFLAPQVWHSFFAISTYERPRVADVNGDGKADIVTFATDSPTAFGDVYVALSNGRQFVDQNGIPSSSTKWHDWFAVDPAQQIRVGDINGDGKADFFTFMPSPMAQCYTVASQGTSMASNVLWPESVAPLPTDVPFVGDVNGDKKADIIVFAQGEGKVYVSRGH